MLTIDCVMPYHAVDIDHSLMYPELTLIGIYPEVGIITATDVDVYV